MTDEDTTRIAFLTTQAILSTMEATIEAMMKAIEAAEERTREMRENAERDIANFRKITETLMKNVNSHVTTCKTTIDTFQAYHLKFLNGELDVPVPNTQPAGDTASDQMAPRERGRPMQPS